MRTLMKSAAAACAVPVLVVSLAGQAAASDRWTYRSTNMNANTEWIEFGSLPGGVLGNIHVGFLEVYGGSSNVDVWGQVTDWTCPEGELPPDGGGHGEFDEEPPPTNCTLHSQRLIYAFGDDVTFTMDRKLASARLTGVLTVEDHETGQGGQPAADITWTGVGELNSFSNTGKYEEGGTTTYYKESGVGRDADIAPGSFIGAMGFTDDADDTSSAYMSQSKYYERGSTK